MRSAVQEKLPDILSERRSGTPAPMMYCLPKPASKNELILFKTYFLIPQPSVRRFVLLLLTRLAGTGDTPPFGDSSEAEYLLTQYAQLPSEDMRGKVLSLVEQISVANRGNMGSSDENPIVALKNHSSHGGRPRPIMASDSVTNIAAQHYLIIEDDLFTSNLITRALNGLGAYTLNYADDGEAALGYITKTGRRPDIIICALAIPKLDGVSFLRYLAEAQFTGGIILISRKGERILRIAVELAEAHRLNVLGFLRKPFLESALHSMLFHFKGLRALSMPLPTSLVTPEALLEAIEQEQVMPFFQPKVSVKTGKVVGVEALARWKHPERGLVPPALFIPVAEKHGLIEQLTWRILVKTLKHAAAWSKAGRPLRFAINFSALLLSDSDLPDRIEKALGKAGLDPSHLTLEITESGLCDNVTLSMETLLRLRLKGICLSIDDFGTVHSTLEQLHRMPFTELKIDRMFVTGAARDKEARVFFKSAIMLAKKLKLHTVAEGVETAEDWDVCAKLGCEIAQGFFIGRPVPGETYLHAASTGTVSDAFKCAPVD